MQQKLFNRTPLLSGENIEEKREEIRAYFHATLDRTELLFETLNGEEAYYEKPIPLRHPLIFYLGYTLFQRILLANFFISIIIPF